MCLPGLESGIESQSSDRGAHEAWGMGQACVFTPVVQLSSREPCRRMVVPVVDSWGRHYLRSRSQLCYRHLTQASSREAKIMVKRIAALMMGILLSATAASDDNKVHFVGDFESGRVQSKDSTHDGFLVQTLPNPQIGAESVHSGQSDFGPATNADTRIVASEVIGGETVRPRKGRYFLRTEVFREKNYLDLNNYAKNRPRSKIYMSDAAHKIDFDEEGFVGFSVYTPRNFENELGVRDHRGDSMLFDMGSDSSRSLLTLGVWVEKPHNEAHWYVRTYTSATSVEDVGLQVHDLGPVGADIGKWTDFVIRYRFNPFSVATNPGAAGIPSSKNKLFEGNKGILQIWKAEGPADSDGNRQMVLKVDKVNTPVGLVPHATDKIKHQWRIYKFGWLSNPTTLTHPVWFGFDEIRQGLVGRDGTTFADVAPSSTACSSDCPSEVKPSPRPPRAVAVE